MGSDKLTNEHLSVDSEVIHLYTTPTLPYPLVDLMATVKTVSFSVSKLGCERFLGINLRKTRNDVCDSYVSRQAHRCNIICFLVVQQLKHMLYI